MKKFDEKLYYSPSIEEFHYGFMYLHEEPYTGELLECEVDSLFSWKNYEEYSEEYFVKKIDQEDIESLGFKHKGGGWYVKDAPGKLGHWTQIVLRTWKTTDEGREIFIKGKRGPWNSEDAEEQHLFDGIIRNKSELKRILHQIKADEDE